MPDVKMHATVVPPHSMVRLTGRLARLPERDFMVHADRGEHLRVVRQILEEQCSGPLEGRVLLHATVENPHPYPVAWDRLAVEL
jgi:hypothetical protein